MSALLVGASWDQRPLLGPFGLSVDPSTPSSFAPAGAEWTAAQAVYTARSASGFVWIADPASLRVTVANQDGVTAGQSVGYANNWRDVDDLASAAQETDVRRPTFGVVDSVNSWVLSGDQTTTDNQRLALPIMDPSQGTWIVVGRMADATNANQTLFECGPFRLMAQFGAFTGPTVRVAAGEQFEVGLASMLNRWTAFVVQADKVANKLRYIHDGAAGWSEQTPGAWLGAPLEEYEQENYIGRNYFDFVAPFGAPLNGAVHAVIYIDSLPTQAELQTLLDLALRDTAITFTVPPLVEPPPPPSDELPDPLSEVTLASQGAFDTWKAGPPPAGQHATLTFNVNLGALAFSGTEAAPIVIKASSILGRTVTGCGDITGDNIRIWGFQWGGVSPGLLNGRNLWIIRCRGVNGLKLRFRAQGGRAWFCEWDGGSSGRAIAFDTAANAGGTDRLGIQGHIKGCHFKNWAPNQPNATETITVGFFNGRTAVQNDTLIEGCLFTDCNIGGTEDETIAIKGSFVTIRNCTFIRTRFCQNRHGRDNLIERCWHEDSSTGGFAIWDGPNVMHNCKTVGASQTRIAAGNGVSQAENPNTYQQGTSHARAYQAKVYHHDAVNTAPVIGFTFSTPWDPLFAADQTQWLQNRGVAPNLLGPVNGKPRQTSTNQSGTAPIGYEAPQKLTSAQVGVNAAH